MKTGAERREGTNASGARQSFKLPRLSNFFSSCLSWLRWEWFMLTLGWKGFSFEQARKKYCNKGFHKMIRGKLSVHYGKKSCIVEYLNCAFCNWKFFATVEDKRIYLKIQKGMRWPLPRKLFKEAVKRKKERIKNAKEPKRQKP